MTSTVNFKFAAGETVQASIRGSVVGQSIINGEQSFQIELANGFRRWVKARDLVSVPAGPGETANGPIDGL